MQKPAASSSVGMNKKTDAPRAGIYRVARQAASGSDTMSGDAILAGATVSYLST